MSITCRLQRGMTVIEYAIAATLLSLAIIGAFGVLQTAVNDAVSKVSISIGAPGDSGASDGTGSSNSSGSTNVFSRSSGSGSTDSSGSSRGSSSNSGPGSTGNSSSSVGSGSSGGSSIATGSGSPVSSGVAKGTNSSSHNSELASNKTSVITEPVPIANIDLHKVKHIQNNELSSDITYSVKQAGVNDSKLWNTWWLVLVVVLLIVHLIRKQWKTIKDQDN